MLPDLQVSKIENIPIASNCYILWVKYGSKCIIVDPGSKDTGRITTFLLAHNIRPDLLIITHEHFDHIIGVDKLKEQFGCPLVASSRCSFNITNPKKNFSVFHDQVGFSCRPADIIIDTQTLFDWEGRKIEFILTPGHSEGSICFMIDNKLFTGDTLLKDQRTVVKLPGGSIEKLHKSLENLKKRIANTTLIFPGHGDSFYFHEILRKSI